MNTPSHFLLHVGIKKYFGDTKHIRIPKSFVFGAIAPDIGLYLCVIFYTIYGQYFLGKETSETFRYMFDELYFENSVWIFAYNFLHSPLMLVIFLGCIILFKNYLGKYHKVIKWFIVGCMLHTFFDIPLHHNDGPRILYPLNDHIFQSPVSYWDINHYARYVIPVELGLCVSMIVYIYLIPFLKKCLGKK